MERESRTPPLKLLDVFKRDYADATEVLVSYPDPWEYIDAVRHEEGYQLQLQPIGQAQAGFGLTHAVIWEAYFDESRRFAKWQDTLAAVWQRVEQDVNTPTLFTAPDEPAFPTGYREFLTSLGYSQDAQYPQWWSKLRSETTGRAIIRPSSN